MHIFKYIPFVIAFCLFGCNNSRIDNQEGKRQLTDSLYSYSSGRNIFYSQCTNCHFIINEPEEIDAPMSKKSLHEMYKERTTIADLKSALSSGEYHSNFQILVKSDSLNNLKTFIWNVYTPKY